MLKSEAVELTFSLAEVESLHDRAEVCADGLVSLLVSQEMEAMRGSEYRDEVLDALELVRGIRAELARKMLASIPFGE